MLGGLPIVSLSLMMRCCHFSVRRNRAWHSVRVLPDAPSDDREQAMARILTLDDLDCALLGGAVFAAGGGGWSDHGRMLGAAAVTIGRPELAEVGELPEDGWIATAAAIGAPAGTTEWEMLGVDYVRAVTLLQEAFGRPLCGLMIGQNGMSSTVNAWLPAALLGMKVVDAVGDIRAHPTGDMGSLGMAGSPEATIQTAAGGHRASNAYIECVVRGATARVSPIVRTAADMSGGFIASCRNPMRVDYVRANAALGGISRAIALGEAIRGASGGEAIRQAICAATGGTILATGRVAAKSVRYTAEAFDIGTISVDDGGAGPLTLHVMNEYMAVTREEERLATFPDVITTLGADGAPVSVGQIEPGVEIAVLHVAKAHLPLSSSVRDPAVYPVVERALGIDMVSYALA